MRSTADLTGVIRHLRAPSGDAAADPELLDRYARGHDQAAFTTLVHRYGPLVLGVARRQVADGHRAEDVFQATFLALARSAAKLGGRPVLANWLYTVALRQARKARAGAARRAAFERTAPARPPGGADPLAEITGRELVQAVDDELAQLPDRFRVPVLLCCVPVLLCCVQGLSREEACRRLGWSDGALRGRLERGRRMLAARLAARGLAPSALLLAPVAAVTTPPDLVARAVEQATAPWAKSVPAAVADLAATAPRAFLPAAALAGCVLAAALAGWVGASGGANPMQPPPAAPAAAAAPPPAANPSPDDPLPAGVTVRFGSPRYRHVTRIEDLVVSADGKLAVANSRTLIHGALRAYDLTTGRVLHTFHDSERRGDDVGTIALSPDGKMLASTSTFPGSLAVVLYDMAAGKETGRIPLPFHPGELLYAPDGKHVVIAEGSGKAFHLFDLAKGAVIRTFPSAGNVFAVALSPDGKCLLAGGYNYQANEHFARRWEVDTGRELAPLPLGTGGVRSLAYSPDGATVALGGGSRRTNTLRLIDPATGQDRLTIPFSTAGVDIRSLAFSPDGKTIAASGGASTRLFDTATGRERVTIAGRATGLRFSPDGTTLVGAVAGTVYRWDAATGRSLIPGGGESPVAQIAVTPDGKRVVSRGQDGDAHVWDARTGAHERRVNVNWQRGLALSPDGRFLVWPEADEAVQFPSTDRPGSTRVGNRLRLMEVATGKIDERFESFAGDAHDVFFAPDGKSVVTAERYGRAAAVRVWDVATGKVAREFAAEWKPEGRVWRSRPSPDAKVLVVMYQGSTRGLQVESEVKLWDVASGKELAGPTPPWFDPEVMAFTPDGKAMAVVSSPF
ncbi:MAG TPA: sigma-70 family RNA polymerase sigma factor, partial [Urbifossiella sp.]|nr:sigma-70 family RNA polymerase sigma factor [Urbifossiella sp.]